jgi:hypothetical protein
VHVFPDDTPALGGKRFPRSYGSVIELPVGYSLAELATSEDGPIVIGFRRDLLLIHCDHQGGPLSLGIRRAT